MTNQRGIEARLTRLEAGRETEPSSAADVAATALALWEMAGMKSSHSGVLLEQAVKGGQIKVSAYRAAMGYLSDEALTVLAETIRENVDART